ncbi:RDD family protein [Bacillus sp. AGMB 02131]|uniref:RDD family protein n=1 Tax=Peribacillus faecalis TaxID=2772559 RepID=A0A927CUF7_9BACI|nr:RDD family protein [Peribacillus faecalis]MBD3106917.1 RDD family protein [Peribacillus faecalis]
MNYQYASFFSRVGAYFIDLLIVSSILTLLTYLGVLSFFGIDYDISQLSDTAYSINNNRGYMLITIIIGIAYYAGLQSSKWQATIGKRMMKIKVTTMDGRRIGFIRAVVRYIVMFGLSNILFIGYLLALFTKKNQALHDLIARTLVIKD